MGRTARTEPQSMYKGDLYLYLQMVVYKLQQIEIYAELKYNKLILAFPILCFWLIFLFLVLKIYVVMR